MFPLALIPAISALKTFFSPSRIVALIAIIVALGYGAHFTYTRGKEAQAKIDAKQIAQLTKQRDAAVAEKDRYVASYNSWKAASDQAAAKLKQQYEADLQRQQQKLVAAEALAAKRLKDLKHAIPTFIPADADPVLSVGFICLHNLSYEASSAAGDSPLPERGCEDARASSGIRLSEYAEVVVSNADKALSDRRKLLEFQDWYNARKAEVDAAIKAQQTTVPQ